MFRDFFAETYPISFSISSLQQRPKGGSTEQMSDKMLANELEPIFV